MDTLASVIAPHVPYLRRFARALTGSQESGDAYVAAALQTLVEDPCTFSKAMPDRAALFHVFLKIWNSVRLNTTEQPPSGSGDDAAADKKLESVASLPRQAFLLVALEDFSIPEAAKVLDMTEQEVQTLVDQATREIARQVTTDVLIIEDQPLISMDLEDVVTSLDHRVIGVARTHREAITLAKKKLPGLILADIQLADGSSGLEAVNELLHSLEVPVVFITAFPERLLTGQRPEPTFLITKPFQPATVKAIVSQALFFDWKARAKN